MAKAKPPSPIPSQSEKFVAAARELGADDDLERFKAIVRKIGSASPSSRKRRTATESKPRPKAP